MALNEYEIKPVIVDPVADAEEAKNLYGLEFDTMDAVKGMDAVILAVSHDAFKTLTMKEIDKFYLVNSDKTKVLIDIKGILNRKEYEKAGYVYWRL